MGNEATFFNGPAVSGDGPGPGPGPGGDPGSLVFLQEFINKSATSAIKHGRIFIRNIQIIISYLHVVLTEE